MNKDTADKIIALLHSENLCIAPFTLFVNPQNKQSNRLVFHADTQTKIEVEGTAIAHILRKLTS